MENNSLEKFKQKFGTAAHSALLDYTRKMAGPKPLPKYLDKFAQNPVSTQSKALPKVKRIRGSVDIPLNQEGHRQTDEVGRSIGHLDHIIASPLTRSKQTAINLARHTGAPITLTKDLHPWRLGAFEGEPVDNVKDILSNLVLNHPDEKMPGKSPMSTEEGESFNSFKKRLIPFMASLMTEFQKDPRGRLAVVSHLRDVKAMDAWMKAGMPANLDFDRKDMMNPSKNDDHPSSVHKLSYDGKKWEMKDIPLEKLHEDQGHAIYMVRHGSTDFNGSQSEPGAAS